MPKKRPQKKPARHDRQPQPCGQASPPPWDGVLEALAARTAAQSPAPGRPPAGPRPGPGTPRRGLPDAHPVPGTAPAAPAPEGQAAPGPTPTQEPEGLVGVLARLEPQAVAATYWIDTSSWTGPEDVSVRFRGHRVDRGPGARSEAFERVEAVGGIRAGTGRIAVSARQGVTSHGTWEVLAEPILPRGARAGLPARTERVTSRNAALAHGPGVHVFAWPALIALGTLAGILVQALLLLRAGIPPAAPVLLDLAASAVGIPSARFWWLGLHRKPVREFLRAGACIQGFLAGAFATMVLGALLLRLPLGAFLDATAPGLLFGMAAGRPGCFLTGCCYGRPTASRWGLWSSDRRVARRRHPVQLYEAAAALALGAGALAAVLAAPAALPGTVFVASVMAYTIARQLLFPLRTEARTRAGRTATIAACSLLILAAVAASLLR